MKQAHITEHHSRQLFEQLFEGFAADYHLSDASDFLTFQAQVTQSIECLSFRSASDLFEVQGCRSYKAFGGRRRPLLAIDTPVAFGIAWHCRSARQANTVACRC